MYNKLYIKEQIFDSYSLNTEDVFLIYDLLNKKFDYISNNLEEILGISKKKILQNNFILFNYMTKDKEEEFKKLLSTQIKTTVVVESEFIHPIENQKRWISIHIYPVNKENRIIRYICRIVDSTKEKQDHIILKDTLVQLQEANEAKKEFLSHMSHELKTPINAIIGMTQIASKTIYDIDKAKNCLDTIQSVSLNLLVIINNILDMIRVDSNKLVLSNEPFCLSVSLTSFSSLMSSQADQNNQEYIIKTNIKNDYLVGDCIRLHQILGNCLSNSFKFTPSGGKIILEVIEIEKHANKALFRFIITDTGKGMSVGYMEQNLFIPFEQEDSSIYQKYGGTGLGMSITKKLVYLMGGNMRVVSKVNVGTTITIDIAFYINTKPELVLLDKHDTSNIYDFTGKRFLVVEDNEINLRITCEYLSIKHAEIEMAKNGYEALKLFEKSDSGYYNAILMDVKMPELNGYETTKAIRNSNHLDANKVSIIATTADDLIDNDLRLSSGMNYFIAKPINTEILYSVLQSIIATQEV